MSLLSIHRTGRIDRAIIPDPPRPGNPFAGQDPTPHAAARGSPDRTPKGDRAETAFPEMTGPLHLPCFLDRHAQPPARGRPDDAGRLPADAGGARPAGRGPADDGPAPGERPSRGFPFAPAEAVGYTVAQSFQGWNREIPKNPGPFAQDEGRFINTP